MSFDLGVNQIIRYAYNTFASADSVLYLYVGAAFGIFVLAKLVSMAKS
ncbi:hypothetical protein P9027_31375 [Bacillus thuringiensis]|nr:MULTISPECIES: hypothetical protein [Bacillus cereus group]MCU4936944.1 hypothetical protein [Bacillus cereus]MEC3226406.1 hypothetical protein [Bacillus thuringiensis]MEC3463143.1 hypothetical protein [Bacillus thuringiensis]MEC3553548.1 hypothetical protein [Bacillus thuringiensis]MED2059972.1 hypothetical protein [Bacillus thuringiensis]